MVKDEAQKERMQAMGIRDTNKIYTTRELAPGRNLVFAACGVTDGNLLQRDPLHRGRSPHAIHRDDVNRRRASVSSIPRTWRTSPT